MLLPQQLDMISFEYYVNGMVHGRNRLYDHMKQKYPKMFDSRDDVGEWLKYQEVNQFFQYQKKPKVVSSMIPRKPFHSLSLDLIDKSNSPSFNKGLQYRYILVIIDNFSRYLFCYPLVGKSPTTTSAALKTFLRHLDKEWFLPTKAIKFMHMDNGTEFFQDFRRILEERNIGISKTIPYMPQSNSIVERANGVIKRIINKLIFNHANEDYSKWSQFLDEAVSIYNKTKNVSTGKIPNNAVMFAQKQDIDDVTNSIKEKAIKPSPYQNSYVQNQHVRLRIPKEKLHKFDRRNWSEQVFKITRVIFPTRKEMEGEAAKPVRYKIRPIDEDGNYVGKEQTHNYIRESILAIPPLLGYQAMQPQAVSLPPTLQGYVINVPQ